MCPVERTIRRAVAVAGGVAHGASASQSFQRAPERRQRPRDAEVLEAHVPDVHVEVHAVAAARGEHPAPERVGRQLVPEEVGDVPFARRAEAAPGRVDGVGVAGRRASPPGAAPRVVPAVLHEGRHVLPEAADARRHGRPGWPGAEGRAPRRRARRPWRRRAWAEEQHALRLHPVLSPCVAWKPPLKAPTTRSSTPAPAGSRRGRPRPWRSRA